VSKYFNFLGLLTPRDKTFAAKKQRILYRAKKQFCILRDCARSISWFATVGSHKIAGLKSVQFIFWMLLNWKKHVLA